MTDPTRSRSVATAALKRWSDRDRFWRRGAVIVAAASNSVGPSWSCVQSAIGDHCRPGSSAHAGPATGRGRWVVAECVRIVGIRRIRCVDAGRLGKADLPRHQSSGFRRRESSRRALTGQPDRGLRRRRGDHPRERNHHSECVFDRRWRDRAVPRRHADEQGPDHARDRRARHHHFGAANSERIAGRHLDHGCCLQRRRRPRIGPQFRGWQHRYHPGGYPRHHRSMEHPRRAGGRREEHAARVRADTDHSPPQSLHRCDATEPAGHLR